MLYLDVKTLVLTEVHPAGKLMEVNPSDEAVKPVSSIISENLTPVLPTLTPPTISNFAVGLAAPMPTFPVL